MWLHHISRHAVAKGFVRLSFEVFCSDALLRKLRGAGLFERERMTLVVSYGAKFKDSLQNLDWYLTPADTEL